MTQQDSVNAQIAHAADDAYERGLHDGEMAFWRKLAAGLLAAGVSTPGSAATMVADMSVRCDDHDRLHAAKVVVAEDLAQRMLRHGEAWLKREGISRRKTYASALLLEMIEFVTGKGIK